MEPVFGVLKIGSSLCSLKNETSLGIKDGTSLGIKKWNQSLEY